ncbi:DUF6985 domain-containing protein [Antarctobacter sp.]|uniref:DUF6985 domain-containing protein n=1 Tax=Antarctobacter sp. TaxID=1872577 RepID=UPI002B264FB3|nr:hypothetical protein [Antarctobacter sp.]
MEFSFNRFFWQSKINLPAWSEFTGARPTVLTFAPEGRDNAPLSAEELALVQWVSDNYAMQTPIILAAIFEAYPKFRRQFFEDHDIEENEEDLPLVTSAEGLARVMVLTDVFVPQISKDSVPYVGYQFSCEWDKEHGLGVLMHGSRLVEIGGADTAFTLWIAKGDRDT